MHSKPDCEVYCQKMDHANPLGFLYKGEGHTRRFSELKGCLAGITQKVLSVRLKELEREGLVEKKMDSEAFLPEERVHPHRERPGDDRGHQEHVPASRWKIKNIECGSQDCGQCVL